MVSAIGSVLYNIDDIGVTTTTFRHGDGDRARGQCIGQATLVGVRGVSGVVVLVHIVHRGVVEADQPL